MISHEIIQNRVLHTVGVGESQIDHLIGDLEKLTNPTVGLAAHSGQVDVRITAKADSKDDAEKLIIPIDKIIRDRLGDCIYGIDQDKLEQIALNSIANHLWTLTVVEAGLNGILIRRLASVQGPFIHGQWLRQVPTAEELIGLTDSLPAKSTSGCGFWSCTADHTRATISVYNIDHSA